jgi:HK97 family phage major capsid protein
MDELKQIIERITALEGKAQELLTTAEASSDTTEVKALQTTLNDEILPEITRLREQREEIERKEEQKAMRAEVTTLQEVINDLRKPLPDFSIGTGSKAIESADDSSLYAEGKHSFFADVKAANRGRQDALERLGALEGKAMSEGVDAQGGYLVQAQISREIVQARELDNVLRALCSKLNVTTNEVQFDSLSLGTTAGWVAELAEKPELTSMQLASVSASVFTAAGLATISNQLLADSNPAVDGLVTRDLAKRLVALEEAAFLAGTGTNQPLGLLNTPGVQTVTTTETGDVAAPGALLDDILDGIGKVQTEHGQPTAILMHPRTWTAIIKARDAQGLYWLGARRPDQGPNTDQTLFGVRVVLSNRVPTNLGTGTDESRVVIGDFSEALILDRQGITVDESPHVLFTSNQTIFRAEQRVGFTAARQPKAFCIVGGAGLAGR